MNHGLPLSALREDHPLLAQLQAEEVLIPASEHLRRGQVLALSGSVLKSITA